MIYLDEIFDLLSNFANRYCPEIKTSIIPQFDHEGDFYSGLLFDIQRSLRLRASEEENISKNARLSRETLISAFVKFVEPYPEIKVLGEGFIVIKKPALRFQHDTIRPNLCGNDKDKASDSETEDLRCRSILGRYRRSEEGIFIPRLAYEVALSRRLLPTKVTAQVESGVKTAQFFSPTSLPLPLPPSFASDKANLLNRTIEEGSDHFNIEEEFQAFSLQAFLDTFTAPEHNNDNIDSQIEDIAKMPFDIIFASVRNREKNLLVLDSSKSARVDLARSDIADLAIYLSQVSVKTNHPHRDYLQFDNADFDLALTKSRTNVGWFLRFLQAKVASLPKHDNGLCFEPGSDYYELIVKVSRYVTTIASYVAGNLAFNPRSACTRLTIARFEFFDEVCKYLNFARLSPQVSGLIQKVLRFEGELFTA